MGLATVWVGKVPCAALVLACGSIGGLIAIGSWHRDQPGEASVGRRVAFLVCRAF